MRHNGYPRRFIFNAIKPNVSTDPTKDVPKVWLPLPYMSNVSEMVGRILRPLGIGVAHKPSHTLKSKIMKVKDTLPDHEKAGVVYQINCNDCHKTYIGETKRRLGTRIKEHAAAQRKKKDLNSNIVLHALEEGHSFDFDGAKVVAMADSHAARLLKEAWLSNESSINDHIPFPPAYNCLHRRWESQLRTVAL